MRKATLLKIKGDMAAITFDGTRVINGVKIVGDASRMRVNTQVYVDEADGRPVVLTNGVVAPKPSSTVEVGGDGSGTAPHPMSYHTDENEWHRDMDPIYLHDPKEHNLLTSHTVSGLTSGHVMKATDGTSFGFLALLHSELNGVGPSDHHNPVTIGTGGLSSHLALSTQSLTLTAIQHDEMGGLTDDDHTQYVHNTIARTITAQHTFSPDSAIPPFILSSNAQGQTVIGFKADQLNKSISAGDGLDGGGALDADRSLAVDVTDFIDTAYGLTEDTNNIRINVGSGLTFSSGALVPDWGTPTIALGATAQPGMSTAIIRSDATIVAFDTTAPTTIQPDDSAAVGTVAFAARRDHKHAIVAAAPVADSVGVSASAEGTATSFARSDHYHNIDEGMIPTWTGVHTFGTATKLQFRDTGLFVQSSADGQLDISADTTIDLKNGANSRLRVKSSTVEVDVKLKVDADLEFVGAQSITTTADGLTIAPTTTLTLNPGGDAVILDDTVTIKSTSYASQTTGWGISGAGSADFRYLFVDEMHAKSFIADLEQALAGGQIISKSVGILSRKFTAPAAAGTTTLYVWDLPSAAEMAIFQSGDIVRLRSFSRSGGSLTISDCWGVVTSYSNLADREQSWTFTRSSGSNAGAMVAGTQILYDAIVLDYGTTGNGFYEVNAIDGAYAVNSPYAQIVTWATHPHSGQTVRTRLGNLKGIFSLSSPEYGLFAGDGLSNTSKYLRITDTTFEIHNLPIEVEDGTSTRIILQPSGPYIGVGSTAPTSYLGADGFWVGNDSGTYKFHLGDIDGERLQWTGSALQIYAATGTYITATGTNITMYANSLQAITLDGANTRVTVGNPSAENVNVTATQVQIRDGTTLRSTVDGAAFKIYHTNGTQVLADIGTTITLYDSGGADRLVLSTSGVTVGDITEGEYATITSSGITLYGNAIAHLNLNSLGTLWAGDTSTSERIQWDTTNGLRIYDANNNPVLSSSPSGVTWLSTLAISESLGQSLFSSADGLLLLGPGCALTPTSWTSTRGQAATISGAFHQVQGRWADTKALVVEKGTTNRVTNPSLEVDTTGYAATGVGTTIARIITDAVYGVAALEVAVGDSSGAGFTFGQSAMMTVSPSVDYTLSLYGRVTTDASHVVSLQISWYTSGGSFISTSAESVTLLPHWQRFSTTATSPATAASAFIKVARTVTGTHTYYIDAVQLEQSACPTSYCDGSFGTGYAWSGTANASNSVRTRTTTNLDSYAAICNGNELSFATWVQPLYDSSATWPDSAYTKYISCVRGSTSGHRVDLYFDPASDEIGMYENGGRLEKVTTFTAGDWIHVATTIDHISMVRRLYINGALVASDTNAHSSAPNDFDTWRIGNVYNNSSGHSGAFAFGEYAVFGRVLTAEEIAALYAAGRPMADMGAFRRPGVYILDGEFDIRSSQTGARVQIDVNGVAGYSATTVKTFSLETDGDLFLGSDISAPATTALAVFATAQTYGTAAESMGAGDVLLGDNSTGKANLLWDVSEGDMILRYGTTAAITLDASASKLIVGRTTANRIEISSTTFTLYDAGNASQVEIGTGFIVLGNMSGGEYMTVSGINGLGLNANSVKRVGITAEGILTINDSGGAAVFTFDSAAGAEFTKPLTLGTSGGIYQGTGTFASPTTGLKIWNDSGVGRIGGYNAGTLQWYANTDGKLYAGGGNVVLDSSGLTIAAGGLSPNQVKWSHGTTTKYGRMWSWLDSSDLYVAITASCTTSSGNSGIISLTSEGYSNNTVLRVFSKDVSIDGSSSDTSLSVVGGITIGSATVSSQSGVLRMLERSANTDNPSSGSEVMIFMKADKLIIKYNDGGTVRYKYLDLTGTGVTWVHSTSAP